VGKEKWYRTSCCSDSSTVRVGKENIMENIQNMVGATVVSADNYSDNGIKIVFDNGVLFVVGDEGYSVAISSSIEEALSIYNDL
jgi:hypothetical protein